MRHRLLQATLPTQLIGEVEVGIGKIRLQLYGTFEGILGILEAALAQIDIPQVVMRSRELRVNDDRLRDQRPRFFESAGLQCDNTKQVLRIQMLRYRGQDLAVEGLGLLEPSGLVVRNPNTKQSVGTACG